MILLAMTEIDIRSRPMLKMPNSFPFSGKSVSAPAAPTAVRIALKTNDPQAAQPIPMIPLPIPPALAKKLPPLKAALLFLMKYAIIAIFTPKNRAIITVEIAEKTVKFVPMLPKRFISRENFALKAIVLCARI